ncbi:MAG: hypothetical protein ABSE53_02975 [Terracidiphilus sp.]|jgi:hypothetical protein
MGDVIQLEASETATSAGSQAQAGVADRVYKVVPPTGGASQEDLYGFRAAMYEPTPVENPEAEAKEARSKRALALLPILLILVLGALAVLVIPKVTESKAPPLYVDLGTRRFDSAGLGARLVARWEGATAYHLYIDPVDPQQAAGFQAVTVNPPHPVSLVIRLLDSTGAVACQKEVVLPTPAPLSDSSQALLPMQTTSGDTVQNIAGPDGQIAEVTVTGGLPCSLKQYQSLTTWQFFTNFPTLDEQDEWLKHQKLNAVANGRKSGSPDGGFGFSPKIQHLPAAIDDDDVIVGDNPLRGTVDTQGGRVFLVGVSGLRNRAAEWQVFPAAIHFRCEKTGTCVLTRVNSRTTLQARLIR